VGLQHHALDTEVPVLLAGGAVAVTVTERAVSVEPLVV
jgi:hypothetical protein